MAASSLLWPSIFLLLTSNCLISSSCLLFPSYFTYTFPLGSYYPAPFPLVVSTIRRLSSSYTSQPFVESYFASFTCCVRKFLLTFPFWDFFSVSASAFAHTLDLLVLLHPCVSCYPHWMRLGQIRRCTITCFLFLTISSQRG